MKRRQPRNKEILIYFFFIILAAAFWLFQAINQDYDQDLDVPLEIINIPSNVVITSEVPSSIKIRVRDKGVNLFNYVYGRGTLPTLQVDFNEHQNSAGRVRLLTAELLKPILTAKDFTFLGAKPDTLEFFYNYGLCKRVPVRWQGNFQPAENYTIADIRSSRDSVLVYASKHILDTITAAWLKPVSVTDITDTLTYTAYVQPIRGAKFLPNNIKMHIYTDRMVEKQVQVPIQGINFPAGKHLQTFPATATVTFQVGMKMYRDITEENFILVINYEDLIQSNSNRSHLSLKSIPLGVSQVKITPDNVEFIIEDKTE